MASLHQLLFTNLGRSLNSAMPLSALEPWEGEDLERAMRKGRFRKLPSGPVDCPSLTCVEGCTIRPVPAPEKGPGMVRLPCLRGLQSDMVVPEADVTYVECRTDKAFELLCRISEAEYLFDPSARTGEPAVLVGRVPWAEGAALWFVSTPRRIVGPTEIAPVLVSPLRPALVLVPPGRAIGAVDTPLLASDRVHLLGMERCVDWGLLELNRVAIAARMSAAAKPEPTAGHQAVLVLDVTACEASYRGHKLRLGLREFGVLLALARTPGKTVRKDPLSEMAYAVRNDVTDDDREETPGQLNKFVTHIRNAVRDVAAEYGLEDVDDRGFVKANKPVGYYLTEPSVRIIN